MYLICSISVFHNSAFLSQFLNSIQYRSLQDFFGDKQQVLHHLLWIQHTTSSGENYTVIPDHNVIFKKSTNRNVSSSNKLLLTVY